MEENIFYIPFDEETIQDFAEANFGRKLTSNELNSIKVNWYEYAENEILEAQNSILDAIITELNKLRSLNK